MAAGKLLFALGDNEIALCLLFRTRYLRWASG